MSLKDWFGKGPKGDWVRMDTKGDIKGPCAREPGEGKPKCLPRQKAQSLSRKERASAARRKRREDPVADRKGKGGKPVMVKTQKEELQHIEEKSKPTNPALWSRAKAAARSKFDVYPSAYANGWAVRWYKKRGGGWKTISEEKEFTPHYMYKGDKKVKANKPEDHERLAKMGYTHDDPKKVDEGIVDDVLKSKTLNKKAYSYAASELQKRMKKDPKKSRLTHASTVARYVKGVDARKLAAESLRAKIAERCWAGYKQKGMKKKGDRMVPNCVPEEIDMTESLRPSPKKTAPIEGEKYTGYQKSVQAKDKKKAESAKKATRKITPHMQLKIGTSHNSSGIQRQGQPSNKKVKASKYGPAGFQGAEAQARRRAIERHQEKKREKDYWDDDFNIQGCPLLEKLKPSMGIKKYIGDFAKSDAPQFKGASASKRRQMAVAAYLGAKRKKEEKAMGEGIKYDSNMGAMDWGTPEGTEYMKSNTPGQKTKKKKVEEETEAGETKAEYRKDNSEKAPVLGDYALTKTDIKELEYEADNITWQNALDLDMYDENELDDDIDSTDPHDDVNVTEALSVQGRLKRKFSARKNRQKLKVARGIALRRGSSPDRLKKRATRGARGMVYKRLLKGRDKSKLPPAEKGRLEKLIGMYAPLVSRLAVRMLPGMRKMEIQRMKNRKGGAATKSKKYKAAKPTAKKQTAKKFKIKR